MADERGDHEGQGREHDQHPVQAHALDAVGDSHRDGIQQARRLDRFPKGQPTRGEDDDGPREVVEVLFREDADAEEQHDGDDGDDAHVAEHGLELVARAPQRDGREADGRHERLDARELVVQLTDGHDRSAAARAERHEEEDPDERDGDHAHGDHDEEPLAPTRLGYHDAHGHDVLRRGDGGEHTADVGCEGDAHDDGF